MELIKSKLNNGLVFYAGDSKQPSIVPWLLGSFSSLNGRKNVLEMCAGNGAASFWCVDNGFKGTITLLDRREHVLSYAIKTIEENQLTGIECVCGNVKEFRSSKKYDAILCNPPFFSEYSVSKDDDLRAIRHEEGLTLELLCEAVTRSIKQKGHFYLCHTPSRFAEIVVALYSSKLEIKKIRFCRHTASSLPFLVLIDAVYLGGKGVTVMPDFIVQDEAGNYTEEMKKMIERGCI